MKPKNRKGLQRSRNRNFQFLWGWNIKVITVFSRVYQSTFNSFEDETRYPSRLRDTWPKSFNSFEDETSTSPTAGLRWSCTTFNSFEDETYLMTHPRPRTQRGIFQFLWGWNRDNVVKNHGKKGAKLSIPLRMKPLWKALTVVKESIPLSIPLRMKPLGTVYVYFLEPQGFQFLWGWNKPSRIIPIGMLRGQRTFNSFEDETKFPHDLKILEANFQFLWGWNSSNNWCRRVLS